MEKLNCRSCRDQMCTDGLLSELRCAHCRQIRFECFCAVAVRTSLIAIGAVIGWFFARQQYL
jgi:hypothetical protein